MYRKIIAIILVLSALMLVSCSSDSNSYGDSNTLSNQNHSSGLSSLESSNTDNAYHTEMGVSEQQLKNDLSNHENVIHCFESKFVNSNDYVYEKHSIIKRQTNIEDKEDIIYSSITAKTECISVEMQATAVYGFYDVGGWVLDELRISEKAVTPLQAPNKNIVYNELVSALQEDKEQYDEKYKYSDDYDKSKAWINYLRIYDHEKATAGNFVQLSEYVKNLELGKIEFDQSAKSAQIDVSISSCLSKVNGYIQFGFNDKTGWYWNDASVKNSIKPYVVYKNSQVGDYEEAIGVFKGRLNQGDLMTKIEIFEINQQTITYAFLTGSKPGVERKSDFDSVAGEFYVNGHSFLYNPNTKNWEETFNGDKGVYYRQN